MLSLQWQHFAQVLYYRFDIIEEDARLLHLIAQWPHGKEVVCFKLEISKERGAGFKVDSF